MNDVVHVVISKSIFKLFLLKVDNANVKSGCKNMFLLTYFTENVSTLMNTTD